MATNQIRCHRTPTSSTVAYWLGGIAEPDYLLGDLLSTTCRASAMALRVVARRTSAFAIAFAVAAGRRSCTGRVPAGPRALHRRRDVEGRLTKGGYGRPSPATAGCREHAVDHQPRGTSRTCRPSTPSPARSSSIGSSSASAAHRPRHLRQHQALLIGSHRTRLGFHAALDSQPDRPEHPARYGAPHTGHATDRGYGDLVGVAVRHRRADEGARDRDARYASPSSASPSSPRPASEAPATAPTSRRSTLDRRE